MQLKEQSDRTSASAAGETTDVALSTVLPGFSGIRDQIQAAVSAQQSNLSEREVVIGIIAALVSMRQHSRLGRELEHGLDVGLSARAISEVILQTSLYGGYDVAEEAALTAHEVFERCGVEVTDECLSVEPLEMLTKKAYEFQGSLHGERSNMAHADPTNRYTADLYNIATVHGYGLVWRRPGLLLRERLMVALASFATLGLDSFFSKFADSALDHGVSIDDVIAVVTQLAPHIGFPKALKALTALNQVAEGSVE